MKDKYDDEPVTMDPTGKGCSQVSISMPGRLLADGVTLDVFGRSEVKPKEIFKVAFDIGRGDEVQPIRMTLPRDMSYSNFLRRLQSLFYGDSFERSIRRWEYILVDRGFQKANPLPLTSSNTYYAMVSELLRPRSQWLHAVVRRSDSENPIITAIAEGRYHPELLSPVPDASEPDIPALEAPPLAEACQPDASNIDTPMPDAPTVQTTPELLTSKPPLKACVVTSASARPENRTHSPSPPTKAQAREPSTPSTPVATARGRQLLRLNPPLAPASRARDSTQPYLPLISSPLVPVTSEGVQCSLRPSSPAAPIIRAPRPDQLSPLLAPVASARNTVLLDSSPLPPAASTQPPQRDVTAPCPLSPVAQGPAISLSSRALPTPSAPIPSAQLDRPPAHEASAQGASMRSRSPSMEASLPIKPTTSAQAPPVSLPILSGQLSPPGSGSIVDQEEMSSPLAPGVIAQCPPANPVIASGSASSSSPAPKLFQGSINVPSRFTSDSTSTATSTSTSTSKASQLRPTPILRPRRPLWIVFGQRLNSGTEYKVHWNNGKDSWESHESLYEDYPALVDNYLKGRR